MAKAKPLPEPYFVIAGRAVLLLVQRNLDLPVGRGYGRNVALGNTRPTVRDADIVDEHIEFIRGNHRTDFLLELRESCLCFFDARARGAAGVKPHLPGIDVREEIFAHQPGQPQRRDGNHREGREDRTAMVQRPFE